MTCQPRQPDAGVTLVEMLVALVLFALVGLASFAMLDTVIRARDRTDGRLESIAALDRALTLFSRDMLQSAPQGRSLAQDILTVSMTEQGQEVGLIYQLVDRQLQRHITLPDAPEPLVQSLVADVTAVRWRLLDATGAWHDMWPPVQGGADAGPRAVEMVLTLAGTDGSPAGSLRRIVLLTQSPAS